MFGNFIKRLKAAWFFRIECQNGNHRRSGRHARFNGQIWKSKCRYCGTPIYRNDRRVWVELDEHAN